MDYNTRKKLFILGGAGMAMVILVIIFCIAFSSCGDGNYDKHFDAAEAAFLDKDYDTAIDELEKAIDIEPTEECYLLMAEIYHAQDDIDAAIQVLYLGYSRVGGDELETRLEEMKALKNGGDAKGETISIAGVAVETNAAALVLANKNLTDSDIASLSALKSLDSLSLSGNRLSDISVVAELGSLTFLDISKNGVHDLSPLSALPLLKTLYLDGNPIEDFSALHGLTSLKTLSMKNIAISSSQLAELQAALPGCSIYTDGALDAAEEITIGGQTFMSDVTELNLRGLGISDISQLSKCTKLVKLDLRDNQIRDLSALVDLQELEWLCIWNNQVEDLSPLISLSKLKYIDADGNQIKDLTVLEYLPGLEELWLSSNDFGGNIDSLSSLSSLRRLGLKNSGLEDEDLDILIQLSTLNELALEDNPALTANKMDELKAALPGCAISHSELLYSVEFGGTVYNSDVTEISAVSCGINDLTGLEKFHQLKSLILTGNSVSDLSPLAEVKTLEVLELYGNKVNSLFPLEGHTGLRTLNLLNNNLTDISPLASCTGLREVHLSFNSISDLSPLANCTGITQLDLDANNLSDISALAALTSLSSLSLENNNISDLSPLYTLTLLDTLYIRGNNVTPADVAALQQILPACTIVSDFTAGTVVPEGTDTALPPQA